MGQTQLLLVILGVIIVGIAIFVGVTMFGANAVEDARNAIIHDLQNFSAQAMAYYSKPTSQGGGNRSFTGVTMRQLYPMLENANARYHVESATDNECVIVGVGKVLSDDDSIRVRIRVTPQRNFIELLH
jgi:hypothetical protein